MDKLNDKEKWQKIRNKAIKELRITDKKEKTNIIVYSIVWLIFLTIYILFVLSSPESRVNGVFFWVIWVLTPITQAVKLRKRAKYSKLKELKKFGTCLTWKIFEIKEMWKWFLRDDWMRYQIIVKSDETWEMEYKSQITRFNIPLYLKKWDKIYVYIDNNSDKYFVDIESAFELQGSEK